MLLFRFRFIPETKTSNTPRSNLDCSSLFTHDSVPAQYFVVIKRPQACFWAISGFDNAISRTYGNTCRSIMMTNTINTERFIDDIHIVSNRNSVYWAFRLAGSAKNAGINNFMGHNFRFWFWCQ